MGKYVDSFKLRLSKILQVDKAITKVELAEKAHLHANTLRDYLKGASPSLSNLEKIADVLGCTPIDLITPIDEPIVLKDPLIEKLSDPIIREIIINFTALDEIQREGFRNQLDLVAKATTKNILIKDKKIR